MKKFMLVIVLIMAAIMLVGCFPDDLLPVGSVDIAKSANEALQQANAGMICTGINAYNAMYPNDAITSIPSVAELKDKLGKLYPENIADEEMEKALNLVEMEDGKAQLKEDGQSSEKTE